MEKELTLSQTEMLFGNKIKVTSAELLFKKDITREEWLHLGNMLQYIQGSIHFWLGDWAKYGEEHFGEDYSQGIFGYNSETIRKDIWVCERIEGVRRRTNLPFSYHQEVASLEPIQQDKLLDKADKEKWGREELRLNIISVSTNKKYLNSKAEQSFFDYIKTIKPYLQVTKKGFPDFMLINKEEIVGFIEVKRTDSNDNLRKEQELFKNFCKKYKIPYQVWSPNMQNESWKKANKEFKKRWADGEEIWNKL